MTGRQRKSMTEKPPDLVSAAARGENESTAMDPAAPEDNGRDPVTGRFKVGNRVNPDGRPAAQRVGRDLKSAILAAAADAGLEINPASPDGMRTYLAHLAASEKRAFAGLLGRVLPLQPVRMSMQLKEIATASDVVAASSQIAKAAAEGELTAQEASALANIVGVVAKAIEVHELGERIAKLEQAAAERAQS